MVIPGSGYQIIGVFSYLCLHEIPKKTGQYGFTRLLRLSGTSILSVDGIEAEIDFFLHTLPGAGVALHFFHAMIVPGRI
jgi:hypothetical protein